MINQDFLATAVELTKGKKVQLSVPPKLRTL
jgi:hypothetical protein